MSSAPKKVQGDLQVKGEILVPNESASRATEVDATGKLKSSATTSTELGYLSGVTSSIQTQLGNNGTAISDHLSDATDAHDASAISNIPTGNLAATNQQAVNDELQSDIDSRALDSAVIKKNGSVAFTGPQSMGSNKITSLTDGSSATDAATVGQMDIADGLKVSKSGDTMSGNLAMGNNKVTGLLAGSASNDAVNYAQLTAFAGGVAWKNPILDPDLIDANRAAQPGSPANGDLYIASATAGDWTTGHAYFSIDAGTTWVDLLGRAVVAGDRFGVSMESPTSSVGVLSGLENNIVTIVVATPGSITVSAYAPADQDGTYVKADLSTHFGHQYTYDSATTSWIEFGGISALNAGIGLVLDGNVLSVNMGAGIVQLPSDEVGVDVHSAGGLMTTVDNSTSSTVTAAQLAIKLNGSTLDKSASGLKLGDTAVSPSSNGSATAVSTFTVDQQGRLTAAGQTTIAITASQVTDFNEIAQDAVGNILTDTASIDFTYSDGGNTISAAVLPAGVDHNSLNNFVANKHIDHSAVSIATAAATSGLSGGGDITSTRNIVIDITGTTAESVADNADKILIWDNSASLLKSQTRADFLNGITSGSAGDIIETSFAASNNQAAPANVTGLVFANGVVRSFSALISITIDATADKFESYEIHGVQKGSDWFITQSSVGDDSGVVFSITTAGQIQYTSTSAAGFVSDTIKFRASTTSV